MIEFTQDNGKRRVQICHACHYTYEVDEFGAVIVLGPADNGNKPFIRLLDKNCIREKPFNDLRPVNLYACPRCLTVQLSSSEIED